MVQRRPPGDINGPPSRGLAAGPRVALLNRMRLSLLFAVAPLVLATQLATPPQELPAVATAQLAKSLDASRAHTKHLWRDTPPFNADGTINGYIEIPRGVRRKYE